MSELKKTKETDPLVRVSLETRLSLRKSFKAKAAQEGLSVKEVLERLMEMYVADSIKFQEP
jgi:hypothetical protein